MMLLNSKHFLSSNNIFELFYIIVKIKYGNKIFKLVLADGSVSVLKNPILKSRRNIIRYLQGNFI
jgi:hypothetical protein